MKSPSFRSGWFAGAVLAFVSSLSAQIVEFRAEINAAQEVPTNASGAAGTALVLYNVATNTCDVIITLNGFTNPLTASHIHEAAVGVNGPVRTNFGAENVYQRTGNTLRAKFEGLVYGGDPLKLLGNGAYVNFHTAAFPGGEVRGQLIAQTKRLTAVISGSQENPPVAAQGYGAAQLAYNPGTNKVTVRVNLYNQVTPLTASHIHEGPVGVNGPVKTNFGADAVYTRSGNMLSATFANLDYTGDPIKLLTGGAYLNFHTAANPGGEVRGQLFPSDEIASSRVFSTSARGFVGTGDQVLITGVAVVGPEPVRVLFTARGPSLAGFGVAGVLANPQLTVVDSGGRVVASNDNIVTGAAGAELTVLPGYPTNANESAVLLILPPGNYTSIVSGVGATTGVALSEAIEARLPEPAPTVALLAAAVPVESGGLARAAAVPMEICAAPITR